MLLDGTQCFFARVDGQGLGEILVEDRIDKHRQTRNVIEMSMRQEYMAYRREFGEREIAYARARIYEDVIVDQHRGSTRSGADTAAATEYLNTHNV